MAENYHIIMKRFLNWKTVLVLILLWSTLIRFWRLDYPREYVFDEVYHAFTAKMYSLERYEGWVWWTSPPESVAYEWTHPPLAKVFMSWGIDIFGGPGELPTKISNPEIEQTKEEQDAEKNTNKILANNSFGWRFFGALFGVICTFGIFLLSSSLFRNKWVGVLSAFIFTVDLLPLVQSRTAMNDIYAVTFLVFGFYFFTKRKDHSELPHHLLNSHLPLHYWLLSGIFLGCAIASKWTSFFSLGVVAVYQLITIICSTYILSTKKNLISMYVSNLFLSGIKGITCFAVIPFAIYLLSYWQLFTLPIYDYQGNSLSTAFEVKSIPEQELWIWERLNSVNYYYADRLFLWWGVQKQMWWYHTNLVAEHNYTSKWWSWPLMVRPVWFYVNYCNASSSDATCLYELKRWSQENLYADIYTQGNPILYWGFIPILGYFFVRYLWDFRWWMLTILPFTALTTITYSFNATRPENPEGFSVQFGRVFSDIFPSILLYTMLIFVFMSLVALIQFVRSHRTHDKNVVKEFLPLLFFLLCFSAFWLPWARSPRIMFYYHFFPPVTFMYPFVAYILYLLYSKGREWRIYIVAYLVMIFLSFVYFYPHVTAFLIPQIWREQYWWFKSWQ